MINNEIAPIKTSGFRSLKANKYPINGRISIAPNENKVVTKPTSKPVAPSDLICGGIIGISI